MNRSQHKAHKKKVARAIRVRKKIRGTSLKPRLCVVKSNKHIEVQLINDEEGVTIGSTSTFAKEFRNTEFSKKCKKTASKLGERIAEIANESNIKEVVFDRGPHKYHGILAELAASARSNGLKF
ncbi:MAG: 50S ribosomal protein L18 [Chlamydiota bacterium]|nr:50S ribosomal protein L18 [Chlamydiota bacterium]